MKKSSFIFFFSLVSANYSPASSSLEIFSHEHPIYTIPAIIVSMAGWAFTSDCLFRENLGGGHGLGAMIGAGLAYSAIRYSPLCQSGLSNVDTLNAIFLTLCTAILTCCYRYITDDRSDGGFTRKHNIFADGFLYGTGVSYLAWKIYNIT
jgi:hypothetical protein